MSYTLPSAATRPWNGYPYQLAKPNSAEKHTRGVIPRRNAIIHRISTCIGRSRANLRSASTIYEKPLSFSLYEYVNLTQALKGNADCIVSYVCPKQVLPQPADIGSRGRSQPRATLIIRESG